MRRAALAILSTVAGLVGLLSFKTEATGSTTASTATVGTSHAGTSGTASTGSSSGSSGSSGSSSGSSGSSGASSTATTTGTRKLVTGSVAETQYGPVQVRITVTNGTVTKATAIEYPSQDPRDAQINAYAIPILQRETVGKTSANEVDMISGATYTSAGYLQSLQSALDKAGL